MQQLTTAMFDSQEFKNMEQQLLDKDGIMKLFPAKHFHDLDRLMVRAFCHKHAIYQIPTCELINFLILNATGHRSVIEIGAGAGHIGHHFLTGFMDPNFHITDSKLQEKPEIQAYYSLLKQPLIKYPDFVEGLTADEAIAKYKPTYIYGCWATNVYMGVPWLIDYSKILKNPNIKRLVLVGNNDTHKGYFSRLKDHEVREIAEPWIVSRAANQENNRIWVVTQK